MKEIIYDWGGLNVALFHAINGTHSGFIDSFMQLGTALGGHSNFSLYLSLLVVTAFVALARMPVQEAVIQQKIALRWLAVITVFSIGYVVDGWLISALKPMLDFPRPPLALPDGSVHVVGDAELHHSLPSGHASFAMLVVASMWPLFKRWWKVAGIFFVLWVGISRISLGAHFPADVMAGFLLSLIVVMLVFRLVEISGRLMSGKK
jgi:membrane-associated phospholipid phosphatase